MRCSILLILLGMLVVSCTSTRWIVTEQFELDTEAVPAILNEENKLLIEKYPTPDDPLIVFTAFEITEAEYPLRVKVERSVQQYYPRWGFFLLAAAGATFSFVAANSNAILPSVSTSQKLALNITGGILGVLSFINMQPADEPIFTGETQLIRQSGIEVLQDTVRSTIAEEDNITDLIVTFGEEILFSQGGLSYTNSSLELNLSSFSSVLSGRVDESSEIGIYLMLDDVEYEFMIPVNSFLAPFLNVTEPITLLRNSPDVNSTNILSEVGRGSFLEILEHENEEWFRVRYQNTEAYVLKESGEIEWMTTSDTGPALIFEFAELPFGEIEVENTVPILKRTNEADRALILSNGIDNQIGLRQYLDRDHQLFNHYMTTALQMRRSQLFSRFETGNGELVSVSDQLASMNSEGSLVVYLSGYAELEEIDGRSEVMLIYEDSEGQTSSYRLTNVFDEIAKIEPEALFLFVDLEYLNGGSGNNTFRNGNTTALNRAANYLLNELPNSAIVFSNRPGQHSNLFTGFIDGNKRHHIFNYFWADALKQRKTRVSDLVRHLENYVDYTSRRLHDTPQEIQAYGNLTLNLSQ